MRYAWTNGTMLYFAKDLGFLLKSEKQKLAPQT
jgi:hypothetical protein